MSELIIYTRTDSELKFVRDLMKRMRIKTLLLTEEQEDAALLKAMKETGSNKYVSREMVMKKLGRK